MKIASINEIGKIIRETRISQNMLASELADLSGVSASFLSDLENGKETLQVGKVLHVMDQLGISLSVTTPKPIDDIENTWPENRKRFRP